jgi:beta-mannosidase
MSAFGFQSFPCFETINCIHLNDTINLKPVSIRSHQKYASGFKLIAAYLKRTYKIPPNKEDYVAVSQLLQVKAVIIGIETHSSAKLNNMETLYWQLNDCGPTISWSSPDYFGTWNAL